MKYFDLGLLLKYRYTVYIFCSIRECIFSEFTRILTFSAITVNGPVLLSYRQVINVPVEATSFTYQFTCCLYGSVAGSYVAVPSINKLSGWLFSRVLASHEGGPGSNPGRTCHMSYVQDGDDLGQVSPQVHKKFKTFNFRSKVRCQCQLGTAARVPPAWTG